MRFRKKAGGMRSPGIPSISDDGSSCRDWGQPGQTIVGSHTRIRGTLKGSGPLVIRGIIEGEIELEGSMIVSPGGRVAAEAEVQSLELSGRASGSMIASERVHISSTGMFEGRMASPVIETHPGSVLHGKAIITRPARAITND